MYKQWKAAALCLCAGLVAACTNELSEPDGLDGLRPGDVALQWLPANMAVKNVSTRATDPKTAAEQQINNIHVFVFDAAGNYLEAQGQDAFQGYRFQEGNATMVFRRDMFEQTTQDASNATVVVLANMPKDIFHDTDNDGHPDEIADLTSFNSFIYNLPSFTTSLPEGGLPMMVSKTGIDFTPPAEGAGRNFATQVADGTHRPQLQTGAGTGFGKQRLSFTAIRPRGSRQFPCRRNSLPTIGWHHLEDR